MTRTTEIPRDQWTKALNEFSTVHDGWLISLDVLSSDIGAQPEISNLPLAEVTFEPDGGGRVIVEVGQSADVHLTHTIQSPQRLWIERADNGADIALAIEAADGTETIVRFRVAALPETVDGVARPLTGR